MSEWREVTVEDLKSEAPNALSTGPFGSAISSKYFVDEGIPVIRGSNLSPNISLKIKEDGLAFIPKEKAEEFKRSIARKGDLVFTCWGTINQVGYIDGKGSYAEYVISNKQMRFTPDPDKGDPLFLYYLFSSPQLQQRILNSNIGSFCAWIQFRTIKEDGIIDSPPPRATHNRFRPQQPR